MNITFITVYSRLRLVETRLVETTLIRNKKIFPCRMCSLLLIRKTRLVETRLEENSFIRNIFFVPNELLLRLEETVILVARNKEKKLRNSVTFGFDKVPSVVPSSSHESSG